MFLTVKTMKSKIRTWINAKLSPIYVGPFGILSRRGFVAYRLALPPYIRIHDVFYIYLLKQYVADQSLVINWNNV